MALMYDDTLAQRWRNGLEELDMKNALLRGHPPAADGACQACRTRWPCQSAQAVLDMLSEHEFPVTHCLHCDNVLVKRRDEQFGQAEPTAWCSPACFEKYLEGKKP